MVQTRFHDHLANYRNSSIKKLHIVTYIIKRLTLYSKMNQEK